MRAADGTIIFTSGAKLKGGSKFTASLHVWVTSPRAIVIFE
jgi:hypothetical protein